MPFQHLAVEKITLSADDTKRFWTFSEDEFRATIRASAEQKAKILKAPVSIVGDDGLTLEVVAKYDLP